MDEYIKRFELQRVLPDSVLPHIQVVTFQKGEEIFVQGEQPRTLSFLIEGRLKIFTSSSEGKKLIVAFTQPFSMVGDIELVQQKPYLHTVEAITDGKFLSIPVEIVTQYGMSHLPFVQFLLETITGKFYANAYAQTFNLLHSVDVRFASYLLSITTEEQYVSIHHIRDVADLIGTSYRHLNRIIAQLCEAGYIERSERTIRILNREQLLLLAKQNIYEER
jgi:CRP-like cAMP-binding protein